MKIADSATYQKEAKLLKRLLSRDEVALAFFYENYAPQLLRYIKSKINDDRDVEEIAQDTLFAFLEGIRDFTQKCSLRTYLCSIANNKTVDFYRKRKFKKVLFSQLPQGIEAIFSDDKNPEEAYDHGLIKEKIASVFARLAPHYQRMLRLKYIEGRSVGEIADIFSCTFKSAESLLFRARKAFVRLYTYE